MKKCFYWMTDDNRRVKDIEKLSAPHSGDPREPSSVEKSLIYTLIRG